MKHLDEDFSTNEKGEVFGSFSITLNGVEQKVTIHTTVEKLMQIERNKKNPDSREKEIIEDDEIVLPFKGFFDNYVLGTVGMEGELGHKLFAINVAARAAGYNNIVLKKEDYNAVVKHKIEVKEKDDNES